MRLRLNHRPLQAIKRGESRNQSVAKDETKLVESAPYPTTYCIQMVNAAFPHQL